MVLLQIQRGKLLFPIKTQLICTQQISLSPLMQTHLVEAFHESAHSVSEKDRNTFSRIYDKFITTKQDRDGSFDAKMPQRTARTE